MNYNDVMKSLSELGNARIKKRYVGEGAKEPLFGVTISAMKPLSKKIMYNKELAMELYNSGNYDAMYLAGMIVDPNSLTEEEFEEWINKAYFPMIANFTVAIVLSESKLATIIASKWIKSKDDIKALAGYYTYTWIIGHKDDKEIDFEEVDNLLNEVKINIQDQNPIIQDAMNDFLIAVGISYLPLHKKALEIAKYILNIDNNFSALEQIEKATLNNRIGFKRKNVRC
jgi:3-methyladenine DNA glycosylase AlkD